MKKKWLLWLFVLCLFFAVPVPQISAGEMTDKLREAEQDVCKVINSADETNIMKMADMMEGNDGESLTEHVNKNVLSSKEELEAEKSLMAYIGCPSIKEHSVDIDEKLITYEQLLHYSEQLMKSEQEVEVEQIVMEEFRNETPMFHMEATFSKNKSVTIDSFIGSMASIDYSQYERKETERMLDAYPLLLSLIQVEIIEPLMNLIGSPIEKTADLTANYLEAEKENVLQEDLRETTSLADKLKMDFVVLEADRGLFEDSYYNQHHYPSDSTYMVLERWEEVHQIKPELPYPSKAMDEMDWKGIEDATMNMEDEISDDLFRYIFYDTLPEGDPALLEELAKDSLFIE